MSSNASRFLICPYCDALYRNVALQPNETAYCLICQSPLKNGRVNLLRALIYALTALILFVIANSFPFITLSLRGDVTTIAVISSILALFSNHLPVLGVLVFLFVIVIPLWYLLAVIWVVVSFRWRIWRAPTRRFLHWLTHMRPWNMLEVYLIGVVVTMVKILQMASIVFDAGFWAFVALMFCSVLVSRCFDLSDALFASYDDDE